MQIRSELVNRGSMYVNTSNSYIPSRTRRNPCRRDTKNSLALIGFELNNHYHLVAKLSLERIYSGGFRMFRNVLAVQLVFGMMGNFVRGPKTKRVR